MPRTLGEDGWAEQSSEWSVDGEVNATPERVASGRSRYARFVRAVLLGEGLEQATALLEPGAESTAFAPMPFASVS